MYESKISELNIKVTSVSNELNNEKLKNIGNENNIDILSKDLESEIENNEH